MSPQQEAFVAKRAQQIRYFPWLGGALVLLVLGAWAFVYLRFPLFANPVLLANQLRGNRVDMDTLARLAGYGSLALAAAVVLLLLVFAVMFLSLWNEKRLIDIIRAQTAELEGLRPRLGGAPDSSDAAVTPGEASPVTASASPQAGASSTEEPKEPGS